MDMTTIKSGDTAPGDVPFDAARCLDRVVRGTREAARGLGRRGAVVAVSGGVDSGVVAGICVRAFGPERVLCLRLPERDIGGSSSDLGLELARALGAQTEEEPITDALEGLGCYRRRDEAIRRVFPDYEPSWPHKLVRSAPSGGVIVFSLVVQRPDGSEEQRRMPSEAYRELISATNMKQRVRKLMEYTWADRLGYAVIGTPNLLEYDQGFFVKGGDGLADVKPIARLYKGQVYILARELGLPEAIATRAPTTETFSMPQTQEEFYFGHPYDRMDLLMWGQAEGVAPGDLASRAGLKPDEVEAAYGEIERRRVATEYLHAPPRILDPTD
jgi:NAD+ synthase